MRFTPDSRASIGCETVGEHQSACQTRPSWRCRPTPVKEWLDLFGLGALLMPAVVVSGGIYKAFIWAQVRLPAAGAYAKSWLLGTFEPISLGSVLLGLNRMIIGNRWHNRQRIWLVLTPTCTALIWFMLSTHDTSESATIGRALDFIRSIFMERPIYLLFVVMELMIIGLSSFAVYDAVTKRLAVPTTNRGAALAYVSVLAAAFVLTFIGYLVVSSTIFDPITTIVVTPELFRFHVPSCSNAPDDWGCTVSGQITADLYVTFYCIFGLSVVPLLLLLILSITFILTVAVFPPLEGSVALVARRYFAVTDQKLALEKPLEFLAPVACVIAFALTSSILILLRSIE